MTHTNGRRRVVVTGHGVVTPLGTGVEKFWAALQKGECGIRQVQSFSTEDLYITIAGEVPDFDPKEKLQSKPLLLADKFSQYAGCAAQEAVAMSKLEVPLKDPESYRAACIIGSGVGYSLSTILSMSLGATAFAFVILSNREAVPFDPVSIIEPLGWPLAIVIFVSVMATNTMVVYGMVTTVVNAVPGGPSSPVAGQTTRPAWMTRSNGASGEAGFGAIGARLPAHVGATLELPLWLDEMTPRP